MLYQVSFCMVYVYVLDFRFSGITNPPAPKAKPWWVHLSPLLCRCRSETCPSPWLSTALNTPPEKNIARSPTREIYVLCL